MHYLYESSDSIMAGQLIAVVIVVAFVSLFFLREWIVANVDPGVFEDAAPAAQAAADQDNQDDQAAPVAPVQEDGPLEDPPGGREIVAGIQEMQEIDLDLAEPRPEEPGIVSIEEQTELLKEIRQMREEAARSWPEEGDEDNAHLDAEERFPPDPPQTLYEQQHPDLEGVFENDTDWDQNLRPPYELEMDANLVVTHIEHFRRPAKLLTTNNLKEQSLVSENAPPNVADATQDMVLHSPSPSSSIEAQPPTSRKIEFFPGSSPVEESPSPERIEGLPNTTNEIGSNTQIGVWSDPQTQSAELLASISAEMSTLPVPPIEAEVSSSGPDTSNEPFVDLAPPSSIPNSSGLPFSIRDVKVTPLESPLVAKLKPEVLRDSSVMNAPNSSVNSSTFIPPTTSKFFPASRSAGTQGHSNGPTTLTHVGFLIFIEIAGD